MFLLQNILVCKCTYSYSACSHNAPDLRRKFPVVGGPQITKPQICGLKKLLRFADLPQVNLALCRLVICLSNLFVICGLKTFASPQIHSISPHKYSTKCSNSNVYTKQKIVEKDDFQDSFETGQVVQSWAVFCRNLQICDLYSR